MALAPRFGKVRFVLPLGPGNGRRPLESREGHAVAGTAGRRRGLVRTARRLAGRPTGRRLPEGRTSGTSRSCRPTARTRERSPRGSPSKGAAGQGAVDWSPDGTRIVTGGRDEKGPALFVIPVETGVPVRIVDGKWVNPVWSPRGDLIVYAGRSLIGQVELRGVRPDGTPVDLPRLLVRPGGYRFLPDGSGPGLLATDYVPGLLAGRLRDQGGRGSSRGSPIRAPCERSTSRPTGRTSCSIARGRTRTSSSSICRRADQPGEGTRRLPGRTRHGHCSFSLRCRTSVSRSTHLCPRCSTGWRRYEPRGGEVISLYVNLSPDQHGRGAHDVFLRRAFADPLKAAASPFGRHRRPGPGSGPHRGVSGR